MRFFSLIEFAKYFFYLFKNDRIYFILNNIRSIFKLYLISLFYSFLYNYIQYIIYNIYLCII